VDNVVKDEAFAVWTFPYKADSAGTAPVATQVNFGEKSITILPGVDPTSVLTGGTLAKLSTDDWTVAGSSGTLTFTATTAGAKGAPARPTVTAPSYPYGYGLIVEHTATGAVAGTANAASVYTSNLAQSGSTGVLVAGEKIVFAHNGFKDTIIFADRAATKITPILAETLMPTPATGVTFSESSDKLVYTSPATAKTALTITVTEDDSSGKIIGTTGLFNATDAGSVVSHVATITGTGHAAGTTVAVDDLWTIYIIGGGEADSVTPTLWSTITVTPTGGGTAAAKTVSIPNNASPADIAEAIVAVTTSGYGDYTAAVSGTTVTLTRTSGNVATLTGLTATIGAP
jgi:hypothetical protein